MGGSRVVATWAFTWALLLLEKPSSWNKRGFEGTFERAPLRPVWVQTDR